MKRLCGPLTIFLALCGFAPAQTSPHPFGLADWIKLSSASPRAVSADGTWILYAAQHGAEKGPDVVTWWLIHPDGSGKQKVELPEAFSPTGFTADGNLFGSYRNKGRQEIATFSLTNLAANSKPTSTIAIPANFGGISISPDGKRFAVLADPSPKDPYEGVHVVIQADHQSLYVVNADGTGGKWWSPELRDVSELAWSPDSRSIALMSMVPKIGHHYVKAWIDISTEQGTKHVTSVDNAVSGIAWLGKGDELAFVSTTTSVLTPDHLYTAPASGGKATDRTPTLAGSVMSLKGAPDGKVYVNVDKGVQTEIDTFADGKLELAYRWPIGYIGGTPAFSPLAGAKPQLVFAVGDPQHTQNLAVPNGGPNLQRITTEGNETLSSTHLGQVSETSWKTHEGISLEGIATFPPDYVKGKRYPFVVLPHGGPEGNDLLSFFGDPQYLAALGYVVLQPEYRGSTGYGSAFLNSIYQHFGDRAYRDVDSATDYAIQQGWADPNRLAMFGWSAGGFMTCWTVTQTNRYKAAVEGAGITDWASFMWTSDVDQFDYDARWPDEDPGAFQKFSAVMYANRVTTPLLILHGAADARVPTYQGREFFELLLARGKTTRMVTYPGSGHFPYLWEQRLDVYRELAAWLKKYDP
jgi:dipeptidyl aminopeptidase/acylaminoacyl peptidase